MSPLRHLSVGERVRQAIEWECGAIKLGNVHPQAAFSDLTHHQFVLAAHAIGLQFDQHLDSSLGTIVVESVRAMMQAAGTNTSLGTILLLAPLAKANVWLQSNLKPQEQSMERWATAIEQVLASMNSEDAARVYEAIRLAKPGGIGSSPSMDVRASSPQSLMEAMRLASSWDDVALQFATNFDLVLTLSRQLSALKQEGWSWNDAIRWTQLLLLASRVDSLIQRKQGPKFANDVRERAVKVLASGPYASESFLIAWQALDTELRDENHRGNPGTTADLLAAAIFVATFRAISPGM